MIHKCVAHDTNNQENKTNKHFDNKSEDAHTKKRKTLKYLEILLNYCYCRFSSQNTCNPKMILKYIKSYVENIDLCVLNYNDS